MEVVENYTTSPVYFMPIPGTEMAGLSLNRIG